MKTVQTWIKEVKASTDKLNHWLCRQYVGEVLAANRICTLAEHVPPQWKPVLHRIAEDEANHARWVLELLTARGLPIPAVSYDGTRYWGPILKDGMTVTQMLAAGAHAEEMRLHRIKALAGDPEIDEDVREVFQRILPDEEFHAKAFAAAAGPEAVKSAAHQHHLGLEALGLEV
jgi:rubrerythrin